MNKRDCIIYKSKIDLNNTKVIKGKESFVDWRDRSESEDNTQNGRYRY